MLFDCFEQDKVAPQELCAKYNSILPSALLNVWKQYGFGSLLNGYLKMINPDEYQALLNESYVLSSTAIPIFVTAFADILTWEKGRYIRIVKYKDGIFEGIASGFNFFWGDLADGAFDARFFELAEYEAATKSLGQLQFDECFGYTPLLGLGGSKKVDNLRKVKIKEHIDLITQSVGKVGA